MSVRPSLLVAFSLGLVAAPVAMGCGSSAPVAQPQPQPVAQAPAPEPAGQPPRSVEMVDGTLVLDGRPRFLYSADYPYYRDEVARWGPKLDRIREMEVPVVTFYVPWRHHCPPEVWDTPEGCDFTGRTRPNRDLLGFVREVQARGLLAVIKPGPFIHAETDYGGLPDYVKPGEESGIAPILEASGAVRKWGEIPLPSAADPVFQAKVERFFDLFEDAVADQQYPAGPIISVQLLNEGIYSSGQRAISGFDYSAPALEMWRSHLTEERGLAEALDPPRRLPRGRSAEDALPNIYWSAFASHYYETILRRYRGFLDRFQVPFVININPPLAENADSFIARNHGPTGEPVAHYGFTNWVGVLPHDANAYPRYQIVARIRRGINMEENWGFGVLYDPAYEHVQPSYFQTMAFVALGATGLNVYTGVATDAWDENIDSVHGRPYPSNPPVRADGTPGSKFWTVQQLGDLFAGEGTSLVRGGQPAALAYGLYLPYAYGAAWSRDAAEWRRLGMQLPPRAGTRAWSDLLTVANRLHVDVGKVDLGRDPAEALRRHRALVVFGSGWMDPATGAKLAGYVRGGGHLVLLGEVPSRDEQMRPATPLGDLVAGLEVAHARSPRATPVDLAGGGTATASGHVGTISAEDPWETIATAGRGRGLRTVGVSRTLGEGRVSYLSWLPFETPAQRDANTGFVRWLVDRAAPDAPGAHPRSQVEGLELRTHHVPDERRTYLFALSYADQDGVHGVTFPDATGARRELELSLPAFSAATVSVVEGAIDAALLKGINDHDERAVAPRVETRGSRLAADRPCDLVLARAPEGQLGHVLTVANVRDAEDVTVDLPFPAAAVRVLAEGPGGTSEPVAVIEGEGGAARFTARDRAAAGPRYRILRSP